MCVSRGSKAADAFLDFLGELSSSLCRLCPGRLVSTFPIGSVADAS
jgi:hypothetical protein